MRRESGAIAALLPLLAACRGPTVNLATSKPLAVDVTLRVDIYQHAAGAPGLAVSQDPADATPEKVEDRRRARMSEVQNLKNSRLVGENHLGLLSIVAPPAGEYGTYVERVVEEENADRAALMRQLAVERRQSLASVEADQARLWRERAFTGEWIEEQQSDGVWRWVQKTAPPA